MQRLARMASLNCAVVDSIARASKGHFVKAFFCLQVPLGTNYYIQFLIFFGGGGIIFGNCNRKLYSMIFLGELIAVM